MVVVEVHFAVIPRTIRASPVSALGKGVWGLDASSRAQPSAPGHFFLIISLSISCNEHKAGDKGIPSSAEGPPKSI